MLGVRALLVVLRVLIVLAVLGVAGMFAARAWWGRSEEPPIRVNGAWLVVENTSKIEWRDVSVTVNAYYRGVAPRVAPGGRLEAPLAGFVTGLGRRFDTTVERVTRVEVRATDAAGKPVALDWDRTQGR